MKGFHPYVCLSLSLTACLLSACLSGSLALCLYESTTLTNPASISRLSRHSWDEMAKYDLPAMLNFVLKKTQQPSLYYVGHSQGTLIAFAELSRNVDLSNKVKAFFALGPVTTVGNMESPIKYLSYFVPELEVRWNDFIGLASK